MYKTYSFKAGFALLSFKQKSATKEEYRWLVTLNMEHICDVTVVYVSSRELRIYCTAS